MRDGMEGLDAWLEAPYQDRAEEQERLECPECNAQMDETVDGGVDCPECDYEFEPDWESIAEARAEARAERRGFREP